MFKNYYKGNSFLIVLFFITSFLLLYKLYNNIQYKEQFETKKENIDSTSVIPLDIYTTWHTKDLPEKMNECVERLKSANPEFTHHLFDEDGCRQFIFENFDSGVVNTFDSLVPLSYKSDLWRYCVLYKKGGIYIDIKFGPMNNFKFSTMVDKEYFTKDLDWSGGGALTGIIICKSNNSKMKNCIDKIVENVNNKYYGDGPLDPTGPILFKSQFDKSEIDNFEYELQVGPVNNQFFIVKRGEQIENAILASYPEYRMEQAAYGKLKYYGDLWSENNIYR